MNYFHSLPNCCNNNCELILFLRSKSTKTKRDTGDHRNKNGWTLSSIIFQQGRAKRPPSLFQRTPQRFRNPDTRSSWTGRAGSKRICWRSWIPSLAPFILPKCGRTHDFFPVMTEKGGGSGTLEGELLYSMPSGLSEPWWAAQPSSPAGLQSDDCQTTPSTPCSQDPPLRNCRS